MGEGSACTLTRRSLTPRSLSHGWLARAMLTAFPVGMRSSSAVSLLRTDRPTEHCRSPSLSKRAPVASRATARSCGALLVAFGAGWLTSSVPSCRRPVRSRTIPLVLVRVRSSAKSSAVGGEPASARSALALPVSLPSSPSRWSQLCGLRAEVGLSSLETRVAGVVERLEPLAGAVDSATGGVGTGQPASEARRALEPRL